MPTSIFELFDCRCRGCGYALRALPEPRCPECGRPFDPADSTSMYLGRWHDVRMRFRTQLLPRLKAAIVPRRMTRARMAADIALACLLVTLYGRFDARLLQTAGGAMNILLLAWLAVSVCSAGAGVIRWAWSRGTLPNARSHVRWWCLSAVLVAASLPPVMRGRTCPHATVYDFGYLGVAHSTRGGPCNNAYWRGPRLIGNWWLVYRQ